MVLINEIDVPIHSTREAAIPLDLLMEAIAITPYSNPIRVALRIYLEIGCRPSEINHMNIQNIYDFDENHKIIYWQLGKNQIGSRSELISASLYKEIQDMREIYRCSSRILPVTSDSIRNTFNKAIRPSLSEAWHARKFKPFTKRKINEFVFELKGIRKTWATIFFWKMYRKYNSYSAALTETCKRMKHSGQKITANHYICEFDLVKPWKYENTTACDMGGKEYQQRLFEYNTTRIALYDKTKY